MPLLTPERFAGGMTYHEYVDTWDIEKHRVRAAEIYHELAISADDAAFFRSLAPLGIRVLVLAEGWCPDVVQHLPVLARLGELAQFELRILPRDENLDLMEHYTLDGKHRIPFFVFFTREWGEIGRWVERSRLADRMVEQKRTRLPPADHPDYHRLNRELYREMGQEYRKGHLWQEEIREVRALLAPLRLEGKGAAR